MYFRNYGLRKTWLDQCLKSPVSQDPAKSKIVNAPKYVEIWMTAPLPYILLHVEAIDLQKGSVSDMQYLKIVF